MSPMLMIEAAGFALFHPGKTIVRAEGKFIQAKHFYP